MDATIVTTTAPTTITPTMPSTAYSRMRRRGGPAYSAAGAGRCTTAPVVAYLHRQHAIRVPQPHPCPGRAAVPDHVRERLGDREVRRRLNRGGQPLGHVRVDLDPERAGERQRLDGADQTAIGEDRRMDPTHQPAQLGQRLAADGSRLRQ